MEDYLKKAVVDSHPLLIFLSQLFSHKSSAHPFLCLRHFLPPCLLSLFISSSTPAGLVVSWVQLPSGPIDGWAYGCSDAPYCASTQPSFFFVSLLDHLSLSAFSLFNPTVGFSGTTDSTLGQVLCFLFLFEHSSNRGVMQCTHTHTHTWDTDKQYRHTL